MAKANNTKIYKIDSNVTVNDKLFGSDTEKFNRNKNFTVKSIIALAKKIITGSNQEGILPFSFTYTINDLDVGLFKTDNITLSQITTLSISKINSDSVDLTPILTLLNANLSKFSFEITIGGNPNFKASFNISSFQEIQDVSNAVIGYQYTITSDLLIDTDLVDKLEYNVLFIGKSGGSSTFDPQVADNIAMVAPFGNIPAGTTAGQLRGQDIGTVLLPNAMFATVLAYVQPQKSLGFLGVVSEYLEIGTSINRTFVNTFIKGTIKNGDGSVAGDLVGNMTNLVLKKGATIINTNAAPVNNTDSFDLVNYIVEQGNNNWTATADYDASNTTYTDNMGANGTNLDALKVPGSITKTSATIIGIRLMFMYLGSTPPTNSAGIRALATKYNLSITNTLTINTFIVPAQTQKLAMFLPIGKTIVVQNLGTNQYFPLTRVPVNIDDANSTPYNGESVTIDFGQGFQNPANIKITIS